MCHGHPYFVRKRHEMGFLKMKREGPIRSSMCTTYHGGELANPLSFIAGPPSTSIRAPPPPKIFITKWLGTLHKTKYPGKVQRLAAAQADKPSSLLDRMGYSSASGPIPLAWTELRKPTWKTSLTSLQVLGPVAAKGTAWKIPASLLTHRPHHNFGCDNP